MKFRTEIEINKYDFQIDYHSKIFGLGSCFVNHIGQKMDYFQFQHQINTFGIIFNPFSIRNILERVIKQQFFEEKDLFHLNGSWKSYELHSSQNHSSKTEMLDHINQKMAHTHSFLLETNLAIFTFGTAWIYKLKETGKIVSNCHKVPQKAFDKQLMQTDEIKTQINQIISLLRQINPKLKILLTLSPVRHLKDGFAENQHSKARLLDSLHHFVDNRHVFYFPSYEILMDDLRDYRFYEDDLLHPNTMAVDYVWHKFKQAIFSDTGLQTMKKVEKIRKNTQHRPFRKDSAQFADFQQKTNREIQSLTDEFPWMKFY